MKEEDEHHDDHACDSNYSEEDERCLGRSMKPTKKKQKKNLALDYTSLRMHVGGAWRKKCDENTWRRPHERSKR